MGKKGTILKWMLLLFIVMPMMESCHAGSRILVYDPSGGQRIYTNRYNNAARKKQYYLHKKQVKKTIRNKHHTN